MDSERIKRKIWSQSHWPWPTQPFPDHITMRRAFSCHAGSKEELPQPSGTEESSGIHSLAAKKTKAPGRFHPIPVYFHKPGRDFLSCQSFLIIQFNDYNWWQSQHRLPTCYYDSVSQQHLKLPYHYFNKFCVKCSAVVSCHQRSFNLTSINYCFANYKLSHVFITVTAGLT